MNEEDARLVRELFSRDFIQVLVATAELCWELDWSAQLVIVMGSDAVNASPLDTCFYDGKDHRYVDYPIVDLLEMIGFASRGGKYASGKAVVMTHISKKDYLNKFLFEPLPVESTLHLHLADVLNAAVTSRTVASMQDAIEWLTWFFFYRRLPQNPNFYSLDGVSDAQLSDFLSTLIENTATDLQDAGAVAIDEQALEPLNLGVLSAHLYIRVQTTKLFSLSITAKTKRRGLLQILSSAEEFEEVSLCLSSDLTRSSLCVSTNRSCCSAWRTICSTSSRTPRPFPARSTCCCRASSTATRSPATSVATRCSCSPPPCGSSTWALRIRMTNRAW